MKRLTLILILALTVACGGGNKLNAGEVKSLSYDDPDEVATSYCMLYDTKSGFCTAWGTTYHTDPARWHVEIIGIYTDDNGKNYTKTERHRITEEEYNSCEKGDHWEKDEGCTSG